MNKQPAAYMLASRRNGTLYIGVTSNLVKRIWEHKNDVVEGFTRKYGVHMLVWYELHENMEAAITTAGVLFRRFDTPMGYKTAIYKSTISALFRM